ncbi:duf1749 domain containing protein [Grosmannia clavigera kw1407]|uniref:Duf1749 domain containing protein n=1 Tax=Grosmannia clavigera (strain kw1407 / UAMH 11150) TaxID=655863 RepID=F0XC51_GROCL|nr:duf1749 domain containing protein [Grosmannia clavigera kw1407]EFX03823.1 duf1749 domain containing protein [Grosmannia clavigera kw1407]
MPPPPEMTPFSVTVHPYDSPTRNSCSYELVTATSPTAKNAIVFIGGLTDGPHTVPSIRTIAHQLATTEAGKALGYSVFELRMSSSFTAFGYKRLTDDVADLSALVKYLRGLGREKIVFLGHSTGCQDSMEYAKFVSKGQSPAVDGFILQGPVSDREAMAPAFQPGMYEKTLAAAEKMIKEGRENEIIHLEGMPEMLESPHTAYRLHSLIGKNGDDDYFSTDLPDERLAASWGAFNKPVLVLPSGKDEYVPQTIDVPANIARWKTFCATGIYSDLSGLIPGASHSVEQPDSQLWMADRVIRFLASLQ